MFHCFLQTKHPFFVCLSLTCLIYRRQSGNLNPFFKKNSIFLLNHGIYKHSAIRIAKKKAPVSIYRSLPFTVVAIINREVKVHPGLTDLPVRALTGQPVKECCSLSTVPSHLPYLYHGYVIQLTEYSQQLYPGC